MRLRSSGLAAMAGAVLLAGATGCGRSASGGQEPSAQGAIGIDLPRDDSDFWRAYEQYVKKGIGEQSIRTLPITASHNREDQLRANLQGFEQANAKAVVIAPQATYVTDALLGELFRHGVNVVSVDTEYAKYALFYAQAAVEGRTFRPGPTDHQSTIVALPNGLEDQLPVSLVTKDNVDDKALWGNNLGK